MSFLDAMHAIDQTRCRLRECASAPLMQSGPDAFEHVVERTLGHLRSPALRQIETQVVALRDTLSFEQAVTLLNSIETWVAQHPREVAASGTAASDLGLAVVGAVLAPAAQRLLAQIDAALNLPTERRAPAVQDVAVKWEDALPPMLRGWVNLSALHESLKVSASIAPHMPALKAISRYACTDLMTYQTSASPNKMVRGKARLEAYYADPARLRANTQANLMASLATVAAGKGQLTEEQIQAVGRRVHEAQAGCCTTMAYAALAELLGSPAVSDRIELVVFQNKNRTSDTHCYLLLGREPDSDLAQPDGWGAGARILDPWAVALGGKILSAPDRPPLANMFPPTQSIWERPAEQTDV